DDAYELYNLREDIGETHNLALLQPAKTGELGKTLADWLQQTGADIPQRPNPEFNSEVHAQAVADRIKRDQK
ncbi:MAG: aryl-sulfate sulfohydrolase, partial [Verrucomicrobiia bacterium]